jgi:hypothetical protein
MNDIKKIVNLKNDLAMEIQKVDVTPGSTIIVKPKSQSHILTRAYITWLSETLSSLCPNVNFIILESNNIDIYREPLDYVI